jgi:ribosome biogenesis GTPase
MHTKFGTAGSRDARGAETPPVSLADLGWDDGWNAALPAGPDPLEAGRVSRVDRGELTVLTRSGPRRIRTPHRTPAAVGDWVTLRATEEAGGLGQVDALLERRSAFVRTADGPRRLEQVVAANIDTVLIVTAADHPLSVQHLERFLALAWQSGAVPVVVITKSDLAPAPQLWAWSVAIRAAAPGVAVHAITTVDEQWPVALDRYLTRGQTVALVGLSGAGKSTLVNRLAGTGLLATGSVRPDGQGRHTTTHRELVLLPGGGMIVDTPGMRALSVAATSEGIHLAFVDVEAIARDCAYVDCSHHREPGCALVAAVEAGSLSASRLSDWLGLAAPTEDRGADRLRVLARKRRKADAKIVRRELRRRPVEASPAPPKSDLGVSPRSPR